MKIIGIIQNQQFKNFLNERLSKSNITIEFIDPDKPLKPQISEADIIINGFMKLDKDIIDYCKNLKLIQQSGIGTDGININYCSTKGIFVANVPLANAVSVAEHTLFLILYLAKIIKTKLKKNITSQMDLNEKHMGIELKGKNLLIIGLGVTGIEVAKRAKAFGMKITAITKHPFTKKLGNDNKYFIDFLYGTDKLLEMIPQSDIISIHTPLNKETENMFDVEQINIMKPDAYLINVARAQIVKKDALYNALVSKRISGSAFDVFWQEPADPNDNLLKLDNFVLTPHIAGWTHEATDAITGIIKINIERMLHGQIPLTLVNQEILG